MCPLDRVKRHYYHAFYGVVELFPLWEGGKNCSFSLTKYGANHWKDEGLTKPWANGATTSPKTTVS